MRVETGDRLKHIENLEPIVRLGDYLDMGSQIREELISLKVSGLGIQITFNETGKSGRGIDLSGS